MARRTGRRAFLGESPFLGLALDGLTVDLDGDLVAVQGPPGLDVCAIDRHRVTAQQIVRNGRPSQPMGKPRGVDPRLAGVQYSTELEEKPLHPRVSMISVSSKDTEASPLFVAQGIEGAGHLHQVPSVMPTESIQLAGHEEPEQAQVPGPANLGVEEGTQDFNKTGSR